MTDATWSSGAAASPYRQFTKNPQSTALRSPIAHHSPGHPTFAVSPSTLRTVQNAPNGFAKLSPADRNNNAIIKDSEFARAMQRKVEYSMTSF
jgi:hypothetical protein